jgi:uncharacterized protein (DUF433 family)
MDWRNRISIDPAVCHGKPCIRGTHLMVSVVLENLAAGEEIDDIVRSYHIEPEDIRAALEFAAQGLSDGST